MTCYLAGVQMTCHQFRETSQNRQIKSKTICIKSNLKNQIDPKTNYKISYEKDINETSSTDNVQPNIKLNINTN